MIRLGIMGYGNLGRGVEAAVKHNSDMKLCAIFTRRDPESVKPLTKGVKVFKAEDAAAQQERSSAHTGRSERETATYYSYRIAYVF